MEQEANGQLSGLGVGAVLKAARERADLSLGEVADRLKLSIRQLEAIEHDDFQQLPGSTFVRGFVRNYARFLHVDPEPLMVQLEQHFPSAVNDVVNLVKHDAQGDAAQAAHTSGPEGAQTAGGNAGKWLIIVLLLAALGAVAAWLLSRPAKVVDENKQTLQPMLTEQAASAASVAVPKAETASTPATVAAPAAQPAASAAAVVTQAAPAVVASKPVASTASAADAVPVASTGKISLSAKQAAWISVIDATGKKLQFGTLEAGSSKELSGTPPFQLKIGNAAQVELSFNGQPVALADKIRGTTAKIELK